MTPLQEHKIAILKSKLAKLEPPEENVPKELPQKFLTHNELLAVDTHFVERVMNIRKKYFDYWHNGKTLNPKWNKSDKTTWTYNHETNDRFLEAKRAKQLAIGVEIWKANRRINEWI